MPGMYVRARLQAGVQDEALLVPQQAVSRNATGKASALVVDAENKVARRPVTVDRAIGNRWQVTGGLQAGDRVIVEGSLRVKPGDTVRAVAAAASSAGGASAPAGGGATAGAAAAAAAAALPATR